MHNPKQRKRDLIRRTLTYAVMTLSVVALVVISLFLVLGYSVDDSGQPEQGGLVQFVSFPTGATVSVDGARQSFLTNGKKNTSAGHHSVNMQLKQYRDWDKSFDLGRGELLWLNALLIPKKITTTEVAAFEQIGSMKVSPDKKWIAIIEQSSKPKLKLVDLRDEKKPKVSELAIPAIVAKQKRPNDVFKVVEWDFGSQYILVNYTSGNKTEWLRLDRSDPANARNVSVLKNIAISDAHFVGNSGNVLYSMTAGQLRKIDITKTAETPTNVATSVREFELYRDDRIGYIRALPTEQTVSYFNEGESKSRELSTFKPAVKNVHTAVSSYYNDDYQAVSHGTTIDLYKDPLSSKSPIKSFELKKGVQWLYFSNSGRFVVAQNGSSLAVYDIERQQNFSFNIPGNPPYKAGDHLKWLDDFHFVSDAGGTLKIFEFDGSNDEIIGDVSEGFDITLSSNGKRLFDISTNKTTGKKVLQSSVMVIE